MAKKTMKKQKKARSKSTSKSAPRASRSSLPISPRGERVLIRLFEESERDKKTPSGIILPDNAEREKSDRGTVVAVGPGKLEENGKRTPLDIAVGDKVLFQWGEKVEYDGVEYYLVSESNVLAVIN